MGEGKSIKIVKILLGIIVVSILMVVAFLLGKNSVKEEGKDLEMQPEDMEAIIEESREAARVRSVEAYISAVETTVTSYILFNPDVDITICSQDGDIENTCVIDASPSAKDGVTTQGEKAVTYAGSAINCESASYDPSTGIVTVTNCTVGEDTKNIYSGSTREEIKKVN